MTHLQAGSPREPDPPAAPIDPDPWAHPGLILNALVTRHGLPAVLDALADEFHYTFAAGDDSDAAEAVHVGLVDAADAARGMGKWRVAVNTAVGGKAA